MSMFIIPLCIDKSFIYQNLIYFNGYLKISDDKYETNNGSIHYQKT